MARKTAVRGSELTDGVWERIPPLLPENGRRGKQWNDYRTAVNGILWKLRTGATCYDRFDRWRRDGTWDRLLARAQTKSDVVDEVEWEVSVDSTVARAHQHAAGARASRGRPAPVTARVGSAGSSVPRVGSAQALA